MEQTNFIINTLVNTIDDDGNKLIKFKDILKEKKINFKDYSNEGLLMLFCNFNKQNKSDLDRECRSIILDRKSLEVVSYSCEDPLCNEDAKHFLLNQDNITESVFQCYEGTFMTLFFHNDKWYLTTRRCLDSTKSLWKSTKSHHDMFTEIINEAGYETVDSLTAELNTDYSYNFILIHHENKNIICYKSLFGEKYKKLALAIVRDKNHNELDINTDGELDKFIPENLKNILVLPEKYNDMSLLEDENNKGYIKIPPTNEGLIIKVKKNTNNKVYLLKFQTSDYLFGLAVGQEQNIYKGFLKLYQENTLSSYLQNNKNFDLYRKIENHSNSNELFDTVGTVDAVFKVCTSESFELFKVLWDIKSGQHKNKEVYSLLPKEYKDLMYAIRGIYFNKKADYITNKKNNSGSKIQKSVLKISDIYELFKSYDINKFELFLKSRYELFIELKTNNNVELAKINSISSRCDTVLLKLINIYTIKLIPSLLENSNVTQNTSVIAQTV